MSYEPTDEIPTGTGPQYTKRDAAFKEWHDNESLGLNASMDALRAAYSAGWKARKKASELGDAIARSRAYRKGKGHKK